MAGPHHRGSHPRRAALVRAEAEADPTTRCQADPCRHPELVDGQLVGGTLAQHKLGSTWQAGHEIAGEIGGRLRPEVNECNQHNGLLIGQRRKALADAVLETTRDW